MSRHHEIQKIVFFGNTMLLEVDGKEYNFSLSAISRRLVDASQAERERFEISPSGYGIHWPLIDEDLSVDGLLGICHEPPIFKDKRKAA